MLLDILIASSIALALLPAALFFINIGAYRPLPRAGSSSEPASLSVLIPARNEEAAIRKAVDSALASEGVDVEVVVMDDHSEDATADIVREIARRDSRARLVEAPALPPGWCGKQHACHQLAREAHHPLLVFIDADVRLAPDALVRLAHRMRDRDVPLLSGFPRQETRTFLEKLVLPLMHFLALGFLPMAWMRRSVRPSLGAGCGQLFATPREAYERAGGHAAIRASLHDGITLPRAYRRAGLITDLFDATDIAVCRMYRSAGEVWRGLAKNATEGLGHPAAIVPWTVILGAGQVLPPALLGIAVARWLAGAAGAGTEAAGALVAASLSILPRWAAVFLFRQSPLGALLHPLGVLVLLAIQWYALARSAIGLPAGWKGRGYGRSTSAASDVAQESPSDG